MSTKTKENLKMYGGKIGAWMPLVSFIVFVIALAIMNTVNLRAMWVAAFTCICLTYVLMKDKKDFGTIILDGMHNPTCVTLLPVFLFAGIMSTLLKQSGLIDGLLWGATTLNVSPQLMPFITWFVTAAIALACGTSNGAVASVAPVMFPLAVQMGCSPALVLAAVVSGSMFGNNNSPIGDITIVGTSMLNVDMSDVLKDRVKYMVATFILSSIGFIVLGFLTTQQITSTATVDTSNAKALVMLLIPIMMVFLMAKKVSLFPTLIICDMVGLALTLGFGFISANTLLTNEGPIVSGMEGMVGILIFVILLFILMEFVKRTGAFDALMERIFSKCHTARQAEIATILITMMGCVCTATNSPAMVLVGSMVNETYDKFGLNKCRGANLFGSIACAMSCLLPYTSGMILTLSLGAASGLLPASVTVFDLIKFSMYGFSVFLVFGLCAITGFWSNKKN